MAALLPIRSIPVRLATGAYILHAGIEKWNAPPERAAALQGAASGAFPMLRRIPPVRFVKLLSAGEMALGSALLTPLVSNRLAGLGLTAFSGSLVAMYWRTPTLRRAGSVWPTPQGVAVSKDVWMLGAGLSLLLERGRAAR